jgi:hypothetical protein
LAAQCRLQRLEFTDKKIAVDLKPTEHARQAAEFIGILAPALVKNPAVFGQVVGFQQTGVEYLG